jgi:hypothetical protein
MRKVVNRAATGAVRRHPTVEALGARRADVGQGQDVSWVVMTDPGGNFFDVLQPLPPA